jgi:hypothetical protein
MKSDRNLLHVPPPEALQDIIESGYVGLREVKVQGILLEILPK